MLALKLALVAASILLSSAVARRFGHALAGVVSGMPMIAGPICAILLIDQGAQVVRAIALATLVCIPGAIVHSVSVGWSSRRLPWQLSIGLALSLFMLVGLSLTRLQLPVVLTCVLALAAPTLGLLASPRVARSGGPVPVPHFEIVLRLVAALAMAAAVLLSAGVFPPTVSGLLLAVPITGTVLPCFTLPRYGPQATAALMGGFLMGLHGFAAFFVALYWGLGSFDRLTAFVLALGAALVAAGTVQAVRRQVARARA